MKLDKVDRAFFAQVNTKGHVTQLTGKDGKYQKQRLEPLLKPVNLCLT